MRQKYCVLLFVVMLQCGFFQIGVAASIGGGTDSKFFASMTQKAEDECGSCEDDDSCPPDEPPE